VDLSHAVPPQDVRHAALFLAGCVPYFPPEALHVIVVDPGVGTDRAALYIDVGGHQLLCPDNGCWSLLADVLGAHPVVRRLDNPRYCRKPVSATFHGRDIFAPAAAHLTLGVSPEELGPEVGQWVRLPAAPLVTTAHGWEGEIIHVDSFGNLISNVPGPEAAGRGGTVWLGSKAVRQWVRTYGEAEPGTPVALVSSSGFLEVAVVNGNAARTLAAGVGTPVIVAHSSPPPAYEV
jgi:S-adenosylmethionine hydrolase